MYIVFIYGGSPRDRLQPRNTVFLNTFSCCCCLPCNHCSMEHVTISIGHGLLKKFSLYAMQRVQLFLIDGNDSVGPRRYTMKSTSYRAQDVSVDPACKNRLTGPLRPSHQYIIIHPLCSIYREVIYCV